MNIKKLKEQVAEEFGINIKLPTKWDYAMLLFARTKQQLRMYDRLIDKLIEKY